MEPFRSYGRGEHAAYLLVSVGEEKTDALRGKHRPAVRVRFSGRLVGVCPAACQRRKGRLVHVHVRAHYVYTFCSTAITVVFFIIYFSF